MKYLNRITVSALLVLILASCEKVQSYDIKFGLLQSVDGITTLAEETNKIAYKTRAEGQYFGVVVTPSASEEYTTSKVTYLPGVPLVLSGNLKGEDPDKAPEGYKSPTYRAKGVAVHTMGLDPGDPFGIYRAEVFINGKLEKEIFFEVTKK